MKTAYVWDSKLYLWRTAREDELPVTIDPEFYDPGGMSQEEHDAYMDWKLHEGSYP